MDSFPVTLQCLSLIMLGTRTWKQQLAVAQASWSKISGERLLLALFPTWCFHTGTTDQTRKDWHIDPNCLALEFCVHGWNEGQRIINLALPQKLVLVTTLGHACQNVFEASPLQEKQPTTRKCLIGQHADDANQQITHHNRCMKKTCVRLETLKYMPCSCCNTKQFPRTHLSNMNTRTNYRDTVPGNLLKPSARLENWAEMRQVVSKNVKVFWTSGLC